MKLINPTVQLLKQDNGLEGIFKQIELVGRTCYKSEDKIGDGTAKPFVDRMISSHHTAMLEHGTVYLMCPMSYYEIDYFSLEQRYKKNKYSRLHCDSGMMYVTTNYRVLVENDWLDDLKYLCEPTEHHIRRYTLRFITDRGVSHKEFVA